ncbi:hypothetical protein NIES4071_16550 [Calothrix sp. NIES-4071]|nr:hypothetical protein NIES4071_16550 [Calothrix sp. NIES-4071]BAZ55989.1 hypothetical protein NIES4105_16500 [Calothrix sp. NIES-4105]
MENLCELILGLVRNDKSRRLVYAERTQHQPAWSAVSKPGRARMPTPQENFGYFLICDSLKAQFKALYVSSMNLSPTPLRHGEGQRYYYFERKKQGFKALFYCACALVRRYYVTIYRVFIIVIITYALALHTRKFSRASGWETK